jgi:hypothetical protein
MAKDVPEQYVSVEIPSLTGQEKASGVREKAVTGA